MASTASGISHHAGMPALAKAISQPGSGRRRSTRRDIAAGTGIRVAFGRSPSGATRPGGPTGACSGVSQTGHGSTGLTRERGT